MFPFSSDWPSLLGIGLVQPLPVPSPHPIVRSSPYFVHYDFRFPIAVPRSGLGKFSPHFSARASNVQSSGFHE
jgi:hypothetical protein